MFYTLVMRLIISVSITVFVGFMTMIQPKIQVTLETLHNQVQYFIQICYILLLTGIFR